MERRAIPDIESTSDTEWIHRGRWAEIHARLSRDYSLGRGTTFVSERPYAGPWPGLRRRQPGPDDTTLFRVVREERMFRVAVFDFNTAERLRWHGDRRVADFAIPNPDAPVPLLASVYEQDLLRNRGYPGGYDGRTIPLTESVGQTLERYLTSFSRESSRCITPPEAEEPVHYIRVARTA